MDTYILVAIIAAISYIIVFATFLQLSIRRRINPKKEKRERFFKAMEEGLKSDAISNIDDVINIYKGVSGLSVEGSDDRYGLSNLLREFLVNVISKEKVIAEGSLTDETIRNWKQKITEYISQNEVSSPYADLPPAERNILSDISTFLDNNDKESVKRKIVELAGIIQTRNSDQASIRNINRWTVPLSIIGLVLTIVFGILTIAK
jgi:hypothetical protein